MKTITWLLSLFTLLIQLLSCSTDVPMLAEYKEIPVIYGLLDYKQDTNFVKITKILTADNPADVFAQYPDTVNFNKMLDVRLVEYVNGEFRREIVLDTITKKNKQSGIFPYPEQLLYYTMVRLLPNASGRHVSYELVVELDDQTIVSKTDLVGSGSFQIVSPHLNFSKMYFGTERTMLFLPAENAAFYDVDVSFVYKERRLPSEDTTTTVFHVISGRYTADELAYSMQGRDFCIRYRPEHFFMALREFLGDDTLNKNVWRYITDYPLQVRIDAAGQGMLDYLYLQQLEMATNVPNTDLSCVGRGAVGLFSSRCSITVPGRLAGWTVPDLLAMNWGFRFIGGKEEDLCENY